MRKPSRPVSAACRPTTSTCTGCTSGTRSRLPAGSVYSEPGGANHFARTGAEPVLVEISGVGPTDTRYFDSADAKSATRR